ncbi:MAG TPA: hypothetical protein DCZ94_05700 [Lentisphaeria bacterium]|nr:hypothetical protein [Lentisphaeria bacterium]
MLYLRAVAFGTNCMFNGLRTFLRYSSTVLVNGFSLRSRTHGFLIPPLAADAQHIQILAFDSIVLEVLRFASDLDIPAILRESQNGGEGGIRVYL